MHLRHGLQNRRLENDSRYCKGDLGYLLSDPSVCRSEISAIELDLFVG